MKPAAPVDGPAPAKALGQTKTFRKSSATPRLSPEQMRRQHDVLQSAWRHFGVSAPVIAFLNAPNAQLQGQPLQIAVDSAEGLVRVEKLLWEMSYRA